MQVHEARLEAREKLAALPYYDPREAEMLARHLICEVLHIRPHELVRVRQEKFSDTQASQYTDFLTRMLAGEPLQYIVGRAPFMGMLLEVNRHTLIPRPETEELVAWIASKHNHSKTVLDVGTGSGCIALSLKEAFPAAKVMGIDVSPEAIAIAERNARHTGFLAHFFVEDVLSAATDRFQDLDILVANPPYIPLWERHSLNPNVEAWEPPQALFVPDDDPLMFYRILARRALQWLRPGGWLYVEVHASFGEQVMEMFEDNFLHQIELRLDIQGRQRMVRAQCPART